jgi:Domain of unknown function (DUF4159)
MHVSLSTIDPRMSRVTLSYVAVWAMVVLVQLADVIASWLTMLVAILAFPLGWFWVRWSKQPGMPQIALPIVLSLASPLWWYALLITAKTFGFDNVCSGLTTLGSIALFAIGLAWIVWALERTSRRFELVRIDRRIEAGNQLAMHSLENGEVHDRSWHPGDPDAWYYGRESRKLKQSTLAVTTYAVFFWFASLLISQMPGCQRIYELPAGGGKQEAVMQRVRIEKVVRKKYVVNPYSSIKFEVPPIDEVRLQLEEVTAHQYTIGYGEGTGAGFAGGTSRGKVGLIRLEYDGGDWDLNFGVGGDANMLLEYRLLTQQKVADKSESLRVSQLDRFVKDKSPPLVFLTGQQNLSLSNAEVKSLREYLRDKHGMLFASSGSGHFHNQFMSLMNRVLPDVPPVAIPLDDVIHKVPYSVPSLPYVVPHGGKEAIGWSADGRWLVYYHPGDISDAWSDGHAGVSREVYDSCFRLGVNVINYAHIEYSKRLQSKVNDK